MTTLMVPAATSRQVREMWAHDPAEVLVKKLTGDPRVKSVTRYKDLDRPPKPEGVRIVDKDGKTWDFQIVTTAGQLQAQSGWD